VSVVHHGVDHVQFYPATAPELQASWEKLHAAYPQLSAPYILYVGQLQPRKNIGRLVEAFERLATTDAALKLVIAGGHGWLQHEVLQTIASSPFADRIIQLGRVSQEHLTSLYWHADVYVLPSLYEGFGMPVLEAMASGTPVVTSSVSSMPEIADDAAVLVDAHDSNAIAAGIAKAREHQEQYRKLGIERAGQFTWDATAKATAKVITRLS